jgi:transmembrane sensor
VSAPEPSEVQAPLEEAAEWFALKRSGQMTAHELRELHVWLETEPEKVAAFREIARCWEIAAVVRSDPEILAIREDARQARSARRWMIAAGAMAASLVAVFVATWSLFASDIRARFFTPTQEQAFRTGIGETRNVTLADGSIITLDTDTVLRTHETGRQRLIYLQKGQVFFRVAKDRARPFIVSAAGKTVTALGTVFDVRVDPGKFRVTLVEGKVRVATAPSATQPGQWADMMAGWQLTVSGDDNWSLDPINAKREAKATSWLKGQLTFIGEPLGNVAAEMNRYSRKHIVIDDLKIAQIPIDGVFRTGDVNDFVKLVTAYKLARVASDDKAKVELAAP